ncbi:MAG: LLM class F420-dependent oxidoreductase [bacterium]|nr:LLM class F420-dependent oxidoreductase [bacterium]
MELGLNLGYWGARPTTDMDMVLAAESAGYSVVWAAESWGSDAVTVLSWIGAKTSKIKLGAGILQMPARTPAMTAMTAVTLSELSEGRFILGLGLSGPQVVEGWHGRPYGKPIGKTREYVDIVRRIIAREEPLTHHGEHYQIPYDGPGATGLGKPLKLITHPHHDIPIFIASIGPKNVAVTAEIADGWLPIFYSPAHPEFEEHLKAGFAASGDPDRRSKFSVAPSVQAIVDEDFSAARNAMRPMLSLYIGGMGAKGRNFYHSLASRYGFEKEADEIQDQFLAGNRMAAATAVPDELIDIVCIAGPKGHVAERLAAWQDSGIDMLNVSTSDLHTVRTIAELVG